MRLFQLCISAFAAASLLSACGGGSDDDSNNQPPYQLNVKKVEGRYHNNRSASATEVKSAADFAAPQAAVISLPPLDTEDLIMKASAAGGALQVAQAQSVPQAQTAAEFAQLLAWHSDAQGNSSAAVRINATDAFGLRLGLVVDALPDTATVRVFREATGSQDAVGYEISGEAINSLIQTNAAAGDTTQAGKTWWSANLGGDSVVLQIVLPTGVSSDAVKVALPIVSNLFRDASEYTFEQADAEVLNTEPLLSLTTDGSAAKAESIPSAGSCNLDVNCFTQGTDQKNAVARMLFVSGGNGYFCTGTLLNDAINSNTPYFLTANHCISTQAEASSLQTDWFFRSASCNSALLDSKSVKLTSGARLLFTNNLTQGNDMSLLVLNSAAPAGTYLAGWDANQNNEQQFVYGIHQPNGSLAKISGGYTAAYANCTPTNCVTINSGNGRFYQVGWTEGVTQGGSSGSALFTRNNNYVIGTLFGGASSCTAQSSPDYYGRFDQAFESGIKRFLAWSRVPF